VPGIGDKLPISIRLEAIDTTQVVRSTVRDKDGVQIAGSPFTLGHIGLGLYQINTVGMPDTDFVTISHEIFKGPGFTNKNSKYFDTGAQCFTKDSFEDAVDDLKQAIRGNDLVAEIDDGEILVAQIFEDLKLSAIIDDNRLTAFVEETEELQATISDPETLKGDIKC